MLGSTVGGARDEGRMIGVRITWERRARRLGVATLCVLSIGLAARAVMSTPPRRSAAFLEAKEELEGDPFCSFCPCSIESAPVPRLRAPDDGGRDTSSRVHVLFLVDASTSFAWNPDSRLVSRRTAWTNRVQGAIPGISRANPETRPIGAATLSAVRDGWDASSNSRRSFRREISLRRNCQWRPMNSANWEAA